MTVVGSPVSAVVCVRDGVLRIGRALASIRAQSLSVGEIVVVDGHSGDGTRETAAALDVRVIVQPGQGLADARNAGIAAAAGDLIAFLDHDDRWTPEKLAIQLRLLDAPDSPEAAVGHLVLVDDADGESPIAGPRGAPRLGRTPGTLLARRSAFARIGGFDPALGIGCDMDWFVRAADAGLRIAVAPEIVLLKTVRSDALSADPQANRRAAFAALASRARRRRT